MLPARAQPLPPSVQAAVSRSGLPADAFTVLVAPARGSGAPLVSVRASEPVNPASVIKMVTTYAAVDLLGPDFRWRTGFYADGPVADGVLRGNLYIQGGVNLGANLLYVDAAFLVNRNVLTGGTYGFVVIDKAVCTTTNALDCTPQTLVSGATASQYVFADAIHLSPACQQQLGDYAYDQLRGRW